MPEGQVSHRNALRLGAALAGRRLVAVEAPEPRLAAQRLPERLAGDAVAAVEAVGKHHLIRLESGRTLHSHLGMGGRWMLRPAGAPLRRVGLWLALRTDAHVAAQYGGPRLHLFEPGVPVPGLAALGPDLLDPEVSPGAAMAAALAAADPARAVGEAIVDQRVVAGIGNVVKSEALFMCGIDPWRAVGAIDAAAAAELGETAARILADGVRAGGPLVTHRSPGAPPWRGGRWVYRRAGRPCRRCGTQVRSRGQGDANRTTYWCPACQR